jgi:hypothetical protein
MHKLGLLASFFVAAAACAGAQKPACTDANLGAITAECTSAVIAACLEEGSDYDSCRARASIEDACDRRIDDWETKCR